MVDDVAARCASAGLDLTQPFAVDWYNRVVDGAFRLPDLGRSSTLGVLIGNSRELWPCFLEALRTRSCALDEEHPLDSYVRAAVMRALQSLAYRFEVRFAHEPPPRRVAMQRLAQVSGLAYLSPSHLSVHATYGPWVALRAAVMVDVDGPAKPSPEPPNPCGDCERNCIEKFQHAAAADGTTPDGHAAIERHWELWLAVRDACTVGRAYRYSDDQIHYHYTKDREVLRRSVGRAGS